MSYRNGHLRASALTCIAGECEQAELNKAVKQPSRYRFFPKVRGSPAARLSTCGSSCVNTRPIVRLGALAVVSSSCCDGWTGEETHSLARPGKHLPGAHVMHRKHPIRALRGDGQETLR